jgi:hypothetical protein
MNVITMCSMPFELLGEIFHHLCLNGPLPLRNILHVSKSFYNAAIHNAYLWSTISLDVQFIEYFHNRPYDEADTFLEQCLRLSGTTPLHLKLDFESLYALEFGILCSVWTDTPPITDLHSRLCGLLQTLGKVEFSAFERCASLVWCHSLGRKLTDGVLELLPERLPSLQYLRLSRFDTPSSREQFPECPILTVAHLSGNYLVPPHFWGTNFTRVTSLTFTEDILWVWYDIVTLSLFLNIQHLTICSFKDSGTPQYSSDNQIGMIDVVHFLHLRTLKVTGTVPKEVLAQLEAPVLEELHIEADHRGNTPILMLHDYFLGSHCSILYALLPPMIATADPQWSSRLEALANKCSQLEVVYISGWMEPECKGIPYSTM